MKRLYLSSYEYDDFSVPREVIQYHELTIDGRKVMMLHIENPLIGQQYGWGGEDIDKIYVTNRFEGDSLDKLDTFPIDVYVLIPKNPKIFLPSSLSELSNIAWACLYDNLKDAENHKIS